MSNVASQGVLTRGKRDIEIFDDFTWYVTVHQWTALAADAGTSVTVADGRRGILALTTGATDNNEAAIRSTYEVFLGVAGKPMWCEFLAQYAEANTDDANVCFGFSDLIAANLLGDDGAGPVASMDGALIYKLDGQTAWRCFSANGATTTTNTTAITAGGSTGGYYGNDDGYHTFRIEIADYTSANMQVTFWYDGYQLRDSTTNLFIVHTVSLTSWTEMEVGAYVKAGGANSEVLNIDYIAAGQVR